MRKKNPTTNPWLVTRLQLAHSLGISATGADRIIAQGLRPAGHRGRAKLYRLGDARRLAQREKRATESTNLIALVDAKARRARNDFARLQKKYIAPTQVARDWSMLIARVCAAATTMVDALARRLAAPADAPAITQGLARRVLTAQDCRAILSSDPASHPWRPAATPAIAAVAARDVGIELRDDGTWHELSAEWMIWMRAATPADPITSAIGSAGRACLLALSTMKPPSSKPAHPLPTVKASKKTLRSARAQLAGCQAALVALRDAIANSAVTLRDGAEREGKTHLIAFRARLLALSRLAPALHAAAGVDEIRAMLRRHVDDALDELRPLPIQRRA